MLWWMNSLFLRKPLNQICVESRGTHYSTTVLRTYDAHEDLDPSKDIKWRAPQAFWQEEDATAAATITGKR